MSEHSISWLSDQTMWRADINKDARYLQEKPVNKSVSTRDAETDTFLLPPFDQQTTK